MRFTVGGCRVTVQFWFMALVTLSLFLDRSGMAGIGLVAVILHESGHLLMMSLVGTPPERLSMSLFGLEICQKSVRMPGSPQRALWQACSFLCSAG